jgi:hypothetical protein
MQIYIHRDGQQYGPYPIEEARDHIASGSLHANDLAWHEGAPDWAPLAQVVGTASPATAVDASAAVEPVHPAQPSFVPARRDGAPAATLATAGLVAQEGPTRKPIPEPPPASPIVPQAVRRYSSGVTDFTRHQRAIGIRNMIVGGLFCIGGIAVTYFSYEAAASSPGGGTYFLAWGAIIFGPIHFIKGLIQFCKA